MPKIDFIHNSPIFMRFIGKTKIRIQRRRAFFCLNKLPIFYWTSHFHALFSKKYLSLNFHQIFPDDDLSVEMSSGSFDPYLICQ